MAGKNMSGKYGSSRGTNFGECKQNPSKTPGCFGVLVFLFGLSAFLVVIISNMPA